MNVLIHGLAVLLIGQSSVSELQKAIDRRVTDIPPGLYWVVPYGEKDVAYVLNVEPASAIAQGAPQHFFMTPAESIVMHSLGSKPGAKPMMPVPTVHYPGDPTDPYQQPGIASPYVQGSRFKAISKGLLQGTGSLLRGTANAFNTVPAGGGSGNVYINQPAPFIPPVMIAPNMTPLQPQQFAPLR